MEDREPIQEEHIKLLHFSEESDKFIEKAKSLGWDQESPKSREKYSRTIKEEKSEKK